MAYKLIGQEPFQLPSNADLGTLAYQNADAINVGQTIIQNTATINGLVASLTVAQTQAISGTYLLMNQVPNNLAVGQAVSATNVSSTATIASFVAGYSVTQPTYTGTTLTNVVAMTSTFGIVAGYGVYGTGLGYGYAVSSVSNAGTPVAYSVTTATASGGTTLYVGTTTGIAVNSMVLGINVDTGTLVTSVGTNAFVVINKPILGNVNVSDLLRFAPTITLNANIAANTQTQNIIFYPTITLTTTSNSVVAQNTVLNAYYNPTSPSSAALTVQNGGLGVSGQSWFGSSATIVVNNNSLNNQGSHLTLSNPAGAQSTVGFTFAGTPKGSIRVDSSGNFLMNSSNGTFYYSADLSNNNTLNFINNVFTYLNVWGTTATLYGNTVITSTTNATSTLTGALQVRGGAGIGGDVWINGNVSIKPGGITGNALNLNNNNISGINALIFADAGSDGYIDWAGNFKLWESPDDLVTNTAGNLQFVSGGTRKLTIGNNGVVAIPTYFQSVSTTSGTLVVGGGAGFGGDIYGAGSINVVSTSYINGSRILVDGDLATVITTASFITNDPTSQVGLVAIAGTSTVYGTYNFGDASSIQTLNDYNTGTNTGFYSINDAATTPGYVTYIGFTNVSGFTRLVLNLNYTQNSGHTVQIDLYNYQTLVWDTLTTYSGSVGWYQFMLEVIDSTPYISGATTYARLYHSSGGNTSHRTWVDYAVLQDSIQGGQGPRGATGATGATGPQGLTTSTTSTFIFFNTTNSYSTNTGAVVVRGGVGIWQDTYIGGSLTVAGAINATVTGVITTASNLAGGATGSIPYQSDTGRTSFIDIGATDTLLSSNGTTATWKAPTDIAVNTSTNLAAGAAGSIPYQSGSGNTTFISIASTSGWVLESTGSTPNWTNNLGFVVNTATYANFIAVTDDATNSSPQWIAMASASSGYGTIKTDRNGIQFTPSTNLLSLGNVFLSGTGASTSTTSSNALYVAGGAYLNSLFVPNSAVFGGPVVFNGTATYMYSTQTAYTDNILELHVPPDGMGSSWTIDDGRDIGLRFHYYNSGDKSGALVLANDTKYLEWYNTGAEGTSTFVGTTYGTFKTGAIKLAGGTNASSTGTGDLVVAGGAGIGTNLYVGGTTYITATTSATSTASGALQVFGGVGIGDNLYVANSATISVGKGGPGTGLRINKMDLFAFAAGGSNAGEPTFRTAISSATTVFRVMPNNTSTNGIGAQFEFFANDYFTTPSGWHNFRIVASTSSFIIDTAKDLASDQPRPIIFNLGGQGVATNTATYANVLTITTSGVGINVLTPGAQLDVGGTGRFAGVVSLTSTTNATSTSTGALQIPYGGAGIGQDLYVGGNTYITATTSATSTTTGALIVSGGMGVQGAAYFKGGIPGIIGNDGGIIVGSKGQIFDDGNFHVHAASGTLWLNGGTNVAINNQNSGNVLMTNGTGNVQVYSTQNATSTSTGGLQVPYGGVSIGKNLIVGYTGDSSTTTNIRLAGVLNTFTFAGNAVSAGALTNAALNTAVALLPMVNFGLYSVQNGGEIRNFISKDNNYNIVLGSGGTVLMNNIDLRAGSNGAHLFSTGNTVNRMTISNSGTVTITTGSVSISTTTGAIVAAGGIGIGGAAYIQGNVAIGSSATTAGSLLTVGPTNGLASKLLTVSDMATPANSAGANGILVSIESGGGIYMSSGATGGNVRAKYEAYGGYLGIGTMSAHGTFIATGDATRLSIGTNGVVSVTSNTNATSTTSGALQVIGGVGIGGNAYVGGNVVIGTATNVSSNVALWINSPPVLPAGNYAPRIVLEDDYGNVTGMDFQINYGGGLGLSTSTIAFDFYGSQFGGNGTPAAGPGRGQGSWGMNYVSGRANFSNHWFRDFNYNVQFSIVNNGTFVSGYNYQSYSYAPSYSGLIQGNLGIGTTVTNAALTVVGGATLTGVFTITNTTNATSTLTGALQVVGGAGIGGDVWANNFMTAPQQFINFSGSSGTRIRRDGSPNAMDFQTGFVSRMYVYDSGVVGIFTNSQATSTGTGALQIPYGGLGVGGAIYAGSINVANTGTFSSGINVSGTSTFKSTLTFVSADNSQTIVARMLNSDVLTFSGARGQLFSISDSFTGTIFGVYDISGVPAIEAYDTGNVILTETFGNVGVGTTATVGKLTVSGGAYITGASTITNATVATSTQTGALVVAGGVGIGGAVYAANANLIGSGTNLLINSPTLTGSGWSAQAATVVSTTTVTAPDGSLTAYKVFENTATTWHGIQQSVAGAGTGVWTESIYVKAAERTQAGFSYGPAGFMVFDLSLGTVVTGWGSSSFSTGTITSVGGGWYRVSATTAGTLPYSSFQFATAQGGGASFAGDGTSGVYVWNPQVEPGSALTPLTVTGSTQAFSSGTVNLRGINVISDNNLADVIITGNNNLRFFTNNPANTEQLRLGSSGTTIFSTVTTIVGTTNAVSTQSGALQVRGGVGIGGNTYISGQLVVNTATNIPSAPLVVSTITNGTAAYFQNQAGGGGSYVDLQMSTYQSPTWTVAPPMTMRLTDDGNWSGSFSIRPKISGASSNGNFEAFRVASSGTVYVLGTTNSTNTATGVLVVQGGVGIWRDVWVGGSINVAGTINASVVGITSTATNIQGGTAGQVPFQTGPGVTNFTSTLTVTGNVIRITSGVQSTNTSTGALVVVGGVGISGALNATTKSFNISHPTQPGKQLRYGSLEGPEFGVYVRGRLSGDSKIVLPDYWTKLVDPNTITVDITPVGKYQKLFVKEIVGAEYIVIGNDAMFSNDVNCFYTVYAERADVEKLEVES